MTPFAHQLERYGQSFEALMERAEVVILFGSRAAGLARESSDWDILVVGHGRSRLRPGLDLVYVEPEVFHEMPWRSSELAGHVGRWGRTLCGDPEWLETLRGVDPGEQAIARKRRQLQAQIAACESYWSALGSWARATRQLRLRRDLQRHARLIDSVPVPPSALLDQEWERLCVNEQARFMSQWLASAQLEAHRGAWLSQQHR